MKQRETAILVVSDAHAGKRTSTYNPDILESRIAALSERLFRVRGLLGEYDFDGLRIMMLGDMVDGACIYPTQAHHQAQTSASDQMMHSVGIWRRFMAEQVDVWGDVEVWPVPGNHGRASLASAEIDNWDALLYMMLANASPQRSRVLWPAEDCDPFLRVFRTYGHGYLAYHGNGIPMYQSIPWYGIQTRALRWLSAKCLESWDVATFGHFHSCGYWTFNRLQVFCTGTMASNDEWALERFGWESSAAWWLFGASHKRPVTWQFKMELN